MTPLKRRNPGLGLERRVRPRVEEEPDGEELDVSDEASESSEASESDGSEAGSGSDEEGAENESGASSEGDDIPTVDTSQVSFGALAKAQASLSTSNRRGGADSSLTDGRRLDQDSARSKAKKAPSARDKSSKGSNKHAPTEMSSKKPVPRKRIVVETQKAAPRDPRFAPVGVVADEAKARKAYSFLDEYRDDELSRLRTAAKKVKDPTAKEELRKQVMSMESRKKAQERKDRERAVVEEHRRQEKEMIRQGKKPFYLKRAEQKKRMLLDQYASMGKKKVDKLVERRRKKAAGKEKKNLPMSRRGVES